MKIAYFDCFAGIAGDMTLGALIDCGVPLDALRAGLSSLPVTGWALEAEPVLRSGIHGISVRVSLDGQSDDDELAAAQTSAGAMVPSLLPDPARLGPSEDEEHSHHHHDHGPEGHGHLDVAEVHHHTSDHAHGHGHSHDAPHHSPASHSHTHGRTMGEIRVIIESSALPDPVKNMALAIFLAIAEVEAELHHSTPEAIHFHEIGGVDSLIDICGVAWCLNYLAVERVYCSALPFSTGFVDCAHGRMPVPAPATLKLLRNATLVPTDLQGEMITPTGAGILSVLAGTFATPPTFVPGRVGLGAGKKEWPDRPNLLRIVLAETADSGHQPDSGNREAGSSLTGLSWDELALLETNIDDMNPEFFSGVMRLLFEAGAVDVWIQPIQMKKNRPGNLLSALCPAGARDAVLRTLLRETTTIGVRVGTVRRASMPREIVRTSTRFGQVRVKVARWPEGGVSRPAPEYDDVAERALEYGVSAREVYEAAMAAFSRDSENVSHYGESQSVSGAMEAAGPPASFPHRPGSPVGDRTVRQSQQTQQQ